MKCDHFQLVEWYAVCCLVVVKYLIKCLLFCFWESIFLYIPNSGIGLRSPYWTEKTWWDDLEWFSRALERWLRKSKSCFSLWVSVSSGRIPLHDWAGHCIPRVLAWWIPCMQAGYSWFPTRKRDTLQHSVIERKMNRDNLAWVTVFHWGEPHFSPSCARFLSALIPSNHY